MSKRHGYVTRTGITVKYAVEIFSAETRKIRVEEYELTRGSFPGGAASVIREIEDQKLKIRGGPEMILSIRILSQTEPEIYRIRENKFFEIAEKC